VKILLTGAAGLIGKEVAKGLVSAGFDVLATDLVKDDHSPAQNFVAGDLLSSDFISQLDFACDAIVQLGSIPRPGIASDETVLHNNVIGTYHVFASAVEKNVPLVIYASSLSIYGLAWSTGTSPDYVPVDEKHPLRHFESYALSKEVNERSADMWANRSETAFVGLRFPHTHTEEVFAEMAQKMREGDEEILEQGAKIFWAYLDLRDAVQGILTVIENGAQGSKTYNFAAPDTYAHKPTREMMAEFHPTSKIAATISGYDSIVDCAEWNSAYGYVPKYLFKREDK
jgi:nucleoside-diphosphate-sugar epimerase